MVTGVYRSCFKASMRWGSSISRLLWKLSAMTTVEFSKVFGVHDNQRVVFLFLFYVVASVQVRQDNCLFIIILYSYVHVFVRVFICFPYP